MSTLVLTYICIAELDDKSWRRRLSRGVDHDSALWRLGTKRTWSQRWGKNHWLVAREGSNYAKQRKSSWEGRGKQTTGGEVFEGRWQLDGPETDVQPVHLTPLKNLIEPKGGSLRNSHSCLPVELEWGRSYAGRNSRPKPTLVTIYIDVFFCTSVILINGFQLTQHSTPFLFFVDIDFTTSHAVFLEDLKFWVFLRPHKRNRLTYITLINLRQHAIVVPLYRDTQRLRPIGLLRTDLSTPSPGQPTTNNYSPTILLSALLFFIFRF